MIFLHDDSASEDVVDDIINILRDEMTIAIYDLKAANFSLKSIPAWSLGNNFMLMASQQTIGQIFSEVHFLKVFSSNFVATNRPVFLSLFTKHFMTIF